LRGLFNPRSARNAPKDNANALHYLGLAYLRNGVNDKAITAFKQAIEASREPELRGTAYYNLGLIYAREDLYDEAIGSLEKSM